jgi:hypothetical protein
MNVDTIYFEIHTDISFNRRKICNDFPGLVEGIECKWAPKDHMTAEYLVCGHTR